MLAPPVVLVFLATGLMSWLVLSFAFSDERAVSRRLGKLTSYESAQAREANPTLQPFRERVIDPLAQGVGHAMTSIAPNGYRDRVKHKLVLAGEPRRITFAQFFTVKVLGATGTALLMISVAVIGRMSSLAWPLAAFLVAFAFYLPDIWLSNACAERQAKMRRELPDFLDMLTISVEAGLGFDAAIAKLVRSTRGPLAQEFARMLQQVQAGVSRGDALKALDARTEIPELGTFVSAIIQAETFGISIAGVLRTQAKEMRLKRRQYAEEQAQKAPVKVIFPLVLCILPATMIVVIGPAVVNIGRAFGMF